MQETRIRTIGEACEFAQNIPIPVPLESPCTFAAFKHDAAIPGFTLTRLNTLNSVPRIIKKIQSNAIILNVPENTGGESWLNLPPASLVEYNKRGLRIYLPGQRLFNAEEIAALEEWESMRDIAAEKIDAISDGNSQYYREKRYWEKRGMSYMFSSAKEKGLSRDFNESLVWDAHIKGKLLLEYKVDIPV